MDVAEALWMCLQNMNNYISCTVRTVRQAIRAVEADTDHPEVISKAKDDVRQSTENNLHCV